jgi:hypothetical protein
MTAVRCPTHGTLLSLAWDGRLMCPDGHFVDKETTMSGFAAWTWISANALSDIDVRSHLTDNAVKRLASRIKQDAGYEASENFDLVLVAIPAGTAQDFTGGVLMPYLGPEAKEPR